MIIVADLPADIAATAVGGVDNEGGADIGRVGIGNELDCGSVGISRRSELDGFIGALGGDAIDVGYVLKGPDVGIQAVPIQPSASSPVMRRWKAALPSREFFIGCQGLFV